MGMGATTLISVEEYLRTTYRPDCDYVDGQVLERNVGEKDHGKLQFRIAKWLDARAEELGIFVFQEQRVRVGPRRFRIPDLCVVAGAEPDEQVFTSPPHICIEILSREDRLARMQERLNDYHAFGVPHIWIIDPLDRRAWEMKDGGLFPVEDLVLRAASPEVVLPLEEVFAEMDRRAGLQRPSESEA
jgi:Uma2 family endonuclease